MIPTSPIPDALLLPESMKRGDRFFTRMCSILDIAEPILAVDRSKGDKAYIRKQPGGVLFITRDPTDTILFPTDSPLSGRPRYQWISGANGINRGYLGQAARLLMEEERARRTGQATGVV
jgi:hypothetical protein